MEIDKYCHACYYLAYWPASRRGICHESHLKQVVPMAKRQPITSFLLSYMMKPMLLLNATSTKKSHVGHKM